MYFLIETPTAVVKCWDTWHFAPTALPYSPPMMHWGVVGACKECSSDVKCYSSEGSLGPCRVHRVRVCVNVLISHREHIRLTAWRNGAFIKQVFEDVKLLHKSTNVHSPWPPSTCPWILFDLSDDHHHVGNVLVGGGGVTAEPVSEAALKLLPDKLFNQTFCSFMEQSKSSHCSEGSRVVYVRNHQLPQSRLKL